MKQLDKDGRQGEDGLKKVQQHPDGQLILALRMIPHNVDGSLIPQRMQDGYVNATAMCQSVNKLFGHYRALRSTQDFLDALSADIGIPISDLVISIKGGNHWEQGTWVHPDVAINLGQWCSPKFAVAVSRWVREWASGDVKTKAELPYHLRRYLVNRTGIPHTHWSMLSELTYNLIAPLEDQGYELPPSMVPDISSGRMFCKWLKEKGIDPNKFPTYPHAYEDGRVFPAKLYPNELLADFRRYFHQEWIPKHSEKYFKSKDSKALPFLPKLIEESQTRLIED